MDKLLNYGDKFIKESTWKDIALLKFCVYALGIICGMRIPKKSRKLATCIATLVFIVTYIPLILKLIKVIKNDYETVIN